MDLSVSPRPVRVAIVGSGPSGLYAAEALLARGQLPATCDVFDRLPTPYGLVRGGVAPDHQNIKGVIRVYEHMAALPGFRFFGNVKLGRDIQVQDLRECYDAVVYAVGNESDHKMGVPGEDLPGCHSATEFVGWYNGHPDYCHHTFNLDVENVCVIGMGNVAMDVTRILAKSPAELANSDMASYALDALKAAIHIKRIKVIARRGAADAAFSPKEIKEIGHLQNASLIVAPEELQLDGVQIDPATISDREALQNVQYMLEKSKESAADKEKPRQVLLKFLLSPVEFIAGPNGAVARMKLEKNKLVTNEKGEHRPKGTGEFIFLEVGLVLKAVGYHGIPVPGVPFDERKGIIPNLNGRVVRDLESKALVPGEYVVGWAKRGPSGLIGTNKPDSIATIDALVSDFTAAAPPRRAVRPVLEAMPAILQSRKIRYVSFADWKRVDAEEIRRGQAAGKIREKFLNVDEILAFLEMKPRG